MARPDLVLEATLGDVTDQSVDAVVIAEASVRDSPSAVGLVRFVAFDRSGLVHYQQLL